MVSRGYEAPVADRSNWITVQPNVAIAAGWIAVLIGAVLLTALTAIYILQNGLIAARPPLSLSQTALRIALGGGAMVFWFALYALTAIVAWRVLTAWRREMAAPR